MKNFVASCQQTCIYCCPVLIFSLQLASANHLIMMLMHNIHVLLSFASYFHGLDVAGCGIVGRYVAQ